MHVELVLNYEGKEYRVGDEVLIDDNHGIILSLNSGKLILDASEPMMSRLLEYTIENIKTIYREGQSDKR